MASVDMISWTCLSYVCSVLHEVINGASDKGITPLHVAAVKGHIDITLGFGSFCCSGHFGRLNHNRSYNIYSSNIGDCLPFWWKQIFRYVRFIILRST